MMRGLRPLFGLVVFVVAGNTHAQEMVEIPNPPPEPCCVAVAVKPPPSPPSLLFDVLVGPTYRRAFKEDFGAVLVEAELGAKNQSFGIGARLSTELGATRVGLPYQFVTIGPSFDFRLAPRIGLALALTFGIFVYERVSATAATDPSVYAFSAGANGTLTVDLWQSRGGGALVLLARGGYDYIDNTSSSFTTGSSLALTAALGYRY